VRPNLTDMNQEFPQNEQEVKAPVQMPRTLGVLLDEEVPRKKGTTHRIDDAWRIAVRKRMDEMGISPAELTRRTGASKGHISEVLSLSKGKTTSRWVDAIHEVLKLEAKGGVVVAVATDGIEPRRAAPSKASPITLPASDEKPDGSIAALGAAEKRDLVHQIVDRMPDEKVDQLLAEFLGLRRQS
jgi:hypothetical protein